MAMVVVIGYQLYDTARTDYGMSIREASFQLGLLGLVQFVPLAILTPVAGWVADRFERRRVAIFANMIDLLIAVLLGWFTWNDALTLPLLFALAALHGLLKVLAEALAVKTPQRHVPIAVLRVLLKIPGAPRLLRTDAESLDFIQTTRFDTAATQALARKHQLTWPDLPAALQATARYVAGQLHG